MGEGIEKTKGSGLSKDYLKKEVEQALEIFEAPSCQNQTKPNQTKPNQTDCFQIDYLSLFSEEPRDDEQLARLNKVDKDKIAVGLHKLLQSIRVTRTIMSESEQRLSPAALGIVAGTYLGSAQQAFNSAHLHSAVYGELNFLSSSMVFNLSASLTLDEVISGRVTGKNQIDLEIQNILLGVVWYLANDYGLRINWEAVKPLEVTTPTMSAAPAPTPSPTPTEATPFATVPPSPSPETKLVITPKKKIQREPMPPPELISTPPEELVSMPQIEQIKNAPPIVEIKGPGHVNAKKPFALKAVATDPDGDDLAYHWEQISGPEVNFRIKNQNKQIHISSPNVSERSLIEFMVSVEDPFGGQAQAIKSVWIHPSLKKDQSGESVGAQLDDLAEKTGGKLEIIKPTRWKKENIASEILERLQLEVPKKHYQIMIIVDASGSMKDNIEEVYKQVDKIINSARAELNGEIGEVSLAIRYYVDLVYDREGEMVPLDSLEVLEARAKKREKSPKIYEDALEIRDAKIGLWKILSDVGGSREYHWEAVMSSMQEAPWADSEDVAKVIFLLTDEGDGGGQNILKYTLSDVKKRAVSEGIRIEPILLRSYVSMSGTDLF